LNLSFNIDLKLLYILYKALTQSLDTLPIGEIWTNVGKCNKEIAKAQV